MFVLRLSISVQVNKKIVGIINKRGVQISIGRLEKKFKNQKAGGYVYLALKSTLKQDIDRRTKVFPKTLVPQLIYIYGLF